MGKETETITEWDENADKDKEKNLGNRFRGGGVASGGWTRCSITACMRLNQ